MPDQQAGSYTGGRHCVGSRFYVFKTVVAQRFVYYSIGSPDDGEVEKLVAQWPRPALAVVKAEGCNTIEVNMIFGKKQQVLLIRNVLNDPGVPLASMHLESDLMARVIFFCFGAVHLFYLQEFLPKGHV